MVGNKGSTVGRGRDNSRKPTDQLESLAGDRLKSWPHHWDEQTRSSLNDAERDLYGNEESEQSCSSDEDIGQRSLIIKPKKLIFSQTSTRTLDPLTKLIHLPTKAKYQKPAIGHLPLLKAYDKLFTSLPVYTTAMSIPEWLVRSLNTIPHGTGNTPQGRILANHLLKSLREGNDRRAVQAADGLAMLFLNENPEWEDALELMTATFPQERGTLARKAIEAINGYRWETDSPRLALHPSFAAAGIELDHIISETASGQEYLSKIRVKLPAGIRFLLNDFDDRTWRNLFSTLQKYRNQEMEDSAVSQNFQSSFYDQPVLQQTPLPTYPLCSAKHPQPRANASGSNPNSLRRTPGRRANQNDLAHIDHRLPLLPLPIYHNLDKPLNHLEKGLW